ncbi:unnamed protein product [Echinostoma caproni]|uniref:Transposase n=1 Tax=Echinostoma caproni TaxID=27848 RepID=A0A183AIB2_9TREM|nr:unnamed protein product [Echinostoma caproni]
MDHSDSSKPDLRIAGPGIPGLQLGLEQAKTTGTSRKREKPQYRTLAVVKAITWLAIEGTLDARLAAAIACHVQPDLN